VGTFNAAPTGSVTQTSCPVTGTVHVGDAVSKQAYNDFLSAYAALAPKTGDACTTLTGTLAGQRLAPGTYCFPAAATLTGVLTLDGPANGTWIFKIGTLGTGALTGTAFSVVMAGGGQPCNVTWWVAQAATMTNSNFVGTILAGAAITSTGGTLGGTLVGRAWAKADVTSTGTAVTNTCSASGPPTCTGKKCKCQDKHSDECDDDGDDHHDDGDHDDNDHHDDGDHDDNDHHDGDHDDGHHHHDGDHDDGHHHERDHRHGDHHDGNHNEERR
jgi:hypothetical protein